MSDNGPQWGPPESGPVSGPPQLPQPAAPSLPPVAPPNLPPVGPPVSAPSTSAPSTSAEAPLPAPELSFHAVDEPPRPSRSKLAVGGAVLGVLALGAAGVFAAAKFTGGSTGGAASPEAVGEQMMASIEDEDVLGMVDLLLPGERETFRQPLLDMVGEMSRLEVLSADASLADLAGLDLDLSDEQTVVRPTNVADIANITMSATMSASLDGAELPLGDFVTDMAGEGFDPNELDQPTEVSDMTLPMTVVEHDGRWYLSVFHTIAESIRGDLGEPIPDVGLAPRGGETPEGAVDALLDGVEQLDFSKVIAAINPNEAQALHRYAPLFLDDVEAELENVPLSWQVTRSEYDVTGDGSKRFVTLTALRIDGNLEGDVFSVELLDGCGVVEVNGERFDSCELAEVQPGVDVFDDLFGSGALSDLTGEFEAAFADYEQPGLTVQEVDGEWFISPIGSGFDQMLAMLRALDREELDRLVAATGEFVVDIQDDLGDVFFGLDDFAIEPTLDDIVIDPTLDDTVIGQDAGDASSDDQLGDFDEGQAIAAQCFEMRDVEQVVKCLSENIDAGLLPDFYLGVELAFPECGVADVALGTEPLYTMSDEDYTEMMNTAAACFQALIDDGTVTESDVTVEYLRPECGEGRNPWSIDDEDFFDTWLNCIYAE